MQNTSKTEFRGSTYPPKPTQVATPTPGKTSKNVTIDCAECEPNFCVPSTETPLSASQHNSWPFIWTFYIVLKRTTNLKIVRELLDEKAIDPILRRKATATESPGLSKYTPLTIFSADASFALERRKIRDWRE